MYNVPDNYRDYDDENPDWVHIDDHEEAIGALQHLKDVLKEEIMDLKRAIESGNIQEIDDCIEEIYGYLED